MKVIVIGAGIGGLAAANALRRRGIHADVYERCPTFTEVGAGISLAPNAVKALHKLGFASMLGAIGQVVGDFALRRSNGAFLSNTPTVELKRRFGAEVLLLHRAELLEMLAETVDVANIHLGHACVDIEEDSAGVVARFDNGAVARGDVLAGADGLRSMVRSWLGHHDRLRYSGYTAWRALVPFDTTGVIPAESWGCGKRFGILPARDGRVYWYATANAPEGGQDSDHSASAPLASIFTGWHPPIEALIRASESKILRNDIYDRDPLPDWGRGRVTLLGDAAHPMTPNLGQGACQAMEDALELAFFLATGVDCQTALKQYEASRIPRTSRIVLASRRIGAIGQIDSPFLCSLRNLAFKLTPTGATLRSLCSIVGYEGHLVD